MALQPGATINEIMPTEVMGEIFLRCVPADPLKYQQPDTTVAPMMLCQVCSRWREIALQTPYIWTHLYHVARLKQPSGIFGHRDITFLRWWRERVGGLPSYLRLALKHEDGTPEDEAQQIESREFFADMVQFMSNSRYLNLDFHYNHLLRTLHGERSLYCPNLNTLILVKGLGREAPFVFFDTMLNAIDPGEYDTEDYIPVSNTQHIRRLAMEDLFISLDDVSSILNFSNITHLSLSIDMTLNGWFSLLRASDNLMYGSFKITFQSHLRTSFIRHKVLPHFRQMTFENYGDDLPQSFLDGLLLPSLTELRIDKHYPVTVDYLHRLLTSTPALRILQLSQTYTVDAALTSSVFIPGDLNPPAPLSSIVPHLESIHFDGSCAMINLFDPVNLPLAQAALVGDWLQLGRPGNRISSIHLGTKWEGGRRPLRLEKINRLVEELQKFIPPGVELSLRPLDAPSLWLSGVKKGAFIDEFEDVRFELP